MILTPIDLQPGNKKYKRDPEKDNFTFIQFDSECKLVNRISFKPEIIGWKIDEAVVTYSGNDLSFYIYGPAHLGKEGKYWNQCYQSGKYKAVQVMKVSKGKIDYLTSTDLEEFEAKKKMPPGQKKGAEYSGKKFKRASFEIADNGEYFIMGQHINKTDGPIFGDLICFHFDNQDKLKAHYTSETAGEAKYSYAIDQAMKQLGNNMFWICLESIEQNKIFPSVCKIDVENAEIGNFVRPGNNGKKQIYFLNASFPYLDIQDDQTVFFGNDEKGKTIWFCRLKYE
ncbi:MAG: hypothetical protein C0594_03325 [Marinilabiliales bacterium]|nr:MAG: hypothetical protein C0594_03325 [Marinilabiliales bacterium]